MIREGLVRGLRGEGEGGVRGELYEYRILNERKQRSPIPHIDFWLLVLLSSTNSDQPPLSNVRVAQTALGLQPEVWYWVGVGLKVRKVLLPRRGLPLPDYENTKHETRDTKPKHETETDSPPYVQAQHPKDRY